MTRFPGYFKKLLTLILFIGLSIGFARAQVRDELLASQYMQQGDFEKALVLFDKLFDRNPTNFSYYSSKVNCQIQLKQYVDAEKDIKKLIRKNPDNPLFPADLGYIYALQNQNDKAKEQYDQAIKVFNPDPDMTNRLVNSFRQKRELEYTIQVYLKARKTIRNHPGNYGYEMAELYAATGNFDLMLEEYLDLVSVNPAYLQAVQVAIQTKLPIDPDGKNKELLRISLLRRIQKYPEVSMYSELLIWYMLQQKDFEIALVQAKALDKRNNEDGSRIMSLATMAAANEDYSTASSAFEYLLSKGRSNPYYTVARMELLEAMNKKINKNGYASPAELQKLKSEYYTTLDELGRNTITAPLLKSLAEFEAFHLKNTEQGIKLLQEVIEMPGVRPQLQAEAKLDLGDMLVLQGDVWESALLYGQVDKAYRTDALGQEAKLRNARLSYFRGEFDWARAQLDVLKSATSQLIANDALALSLLISDNTALDTSTLAMEFYSRADLYAFQNRETQSLATLDSILTLFPGHSLEDEVLFKKAQLLKKMGRFEESASLYQKVFEQHGKDILADDALFSLAELQEFQLKNKAEAMRLYGLMLEKYPGSLFVIEARKRFRVMRGDIVN